MEDLGFLTPSGPESARACAARTRGVGDRVRLGCARHPRRGRGCRSARACRKGTRARRAPAHARRRRAARAEHGDGDAARAVPSVGALVGDAPAKRDEDAARDVHRGDGSDDRAGERGVHGGGDHGDVDRVPATATTAEMRADLPRRRWPSARPRGAKPARSARWRRRGGVDRGARGRRRDRALPTCTCRGGARERRARRRPRPRRRGGVFAWWPRSTGRRRPRRRSPRRRRGPPHRLRRRCARRGG